MADKLADVVSMTGSIHEIQMGGAVTEGETVEDDEDDEDFEDAREDISGSTPRKISLEEIEETGGDTFLTRLDLL